MSYPIFEDPVRTLALGVAIFAGASLVTALVGRRRSNPWLIVALVGAIGAVWMTGGAA
ncbi:MAG: hypothetical protein AAFV19_07450 [Pseudomonadota bacterium]